MIFTGTGPMSGVVFTDATPDDRVMEVAAELCVGDRHLEVIGEAEVIVRNGA